MSQKYLLIYRTPATPERSAAPSPEEMQGVMARWGAWKAQFDANIVDMGDALQAHGWVLSGGVVTDGAYIESKEVIGGYSLVTADSQDALLAVVRACPITNVPGSKIEIRPVAGF